MTSNQTPLMPRKRGKKFLIVYAYVVSILLILMTVSSYAWLRLTRTPRVSNLSIYVNTFAGLEIAVDPRSDEWSQQLAYGDLVPEGCELRPATWSDKEQRMYGARYDLYGQLKENWLPLTDEANANNTTQSNYYCVANFYARTGAKTQVSLAPALAINDGFAMSGTYLMGKPNWNSTKICHENMGDGAENAIRIAINVIRLDSEYNPTGEQEFFIYEPNSDSHNDGTFGYLPTPSIDGGETLTDPEKIITQTVSRWGDNVPVQHDLLRYHAGSFDGEGSVELFTMDADEVVQIRILIWLEGQDIDCTNMISNAAIIANLQFDAQTVGGGGLTPIPKDPENNN